MTKERARHYAKVLARGMGKTFYVVCSREGRFLAVQIPSNDCEILATFAPPRRARDTPQLRHEQRAAAANEMRIGSATSRPHRRRFTLTVGPDTILEGA